MGMKSEEIIEVIKELAKARGSYKRIYEGLLDIIETRPEEWELVKREWEKYEFATPEEFIIWFEGDEVDEEEEYNDVQEVIDNEVKSYSRSDYSDTVYIYNDLAYIGETGYDNMIEQIKEDHHLKGGEC